MSDAREVNGMGNDGDEGGAKGLRTAIIWFAVVEAAVIVALLCYKLLR